MNHLVKRNTENECASLKKFINKCNLNGIFCISCPCFNVIKNHFFIRLDQPSKIHKSYSERHLRCLCIMLSNLNSALSKNELVEHVWNDCVVGPNSLPVLIHEIRYMIRDSSYEIINVRMKGYALIRRMYE
ncbi:winged helix-turn-helix domain-containing protein [Aeromonas enteropelogenes]|uniref:winged helix-turn-helix domain-containing protein n=1 Tax=Aeromonas enteropelogenes TaxID=29489 RepID=UPI003B9F4F5A